MPEQPAPRPMRPRPDTGGADLGSLVEMGLAEPPPEPSPEPPPPPSNNPFLAPADPAPEPSPDDAA